MLLPTDEQTPRPQSNIQPRRKGPPAALRIDTPAQKPAIALVLSDCSAPASTLSSANSELDSPHPFALPTKPRTMKNMKRLSLALPSAHSNISTNSLTLSSEGEGGHTIDESTAPSGLSDRRRRPSIVSLPNTSVAARLHRKDECDSPSVPYLDGPIQILPGIWLGSEDNARDWKGLVERGIRSILNVAKEVGSPFDTASASQPLRSFVSVPDLKEKAKETDGTFYPAHGPSGRPAMHYLKLPWSHGQNDLVQNGFRASMSFIDAALDRGDGVLIHCQCGVSRSATVVIALVMRAAALSLPSVPPEVWALKNQGMHGAYAFVKEKSKWVGPNMSLIYQLLDYEQTLNGANKSPASSERSSDAAEEDEEWGRRRRLLDDDTETADAERESQEVMREARALDKAMEDRIVARKASGSSLGSSSGIGMGSAWKSRFGSRARTGSIASNFTSASIISEDLVEENEEEELLGVGGGFDAPSISTRSPSGETTEEEANGSSPDWKKDNVMSVFQLRTPLTARPTFRGKQRSLTDSDLLSGLPPSAPATKTSFGFPRLPFKLKAKMRPPPLNILPPVPSSPIVPAPPEEIIAPKSDAIRRHVPPPLRLKSLHIRSSSRSSQVSQLSLNTPAQTLFVFPPSPTLQAQTPHTVTVTSTLNISKQTLAAPTPRVSTFKTDGRRRSFIGLTAPPTPTTACSRVDARGWVWVGPSAK